MFTPMGFVRFAGVVNPLAGGLAESVTTTPTNATAGWRFNVNGTVDRKIQSTFTFNHNWFNPSGGTPGNSYWVRCTVNSGTTPGPDATGSWIALSAARLWELTDTASSGPAIVCNLTIAIASDSGGTNIVGSGTYTISVQETA